MMVSANCRRERKRTSRDMGVSEGCVADDGCAVWDAVRSSVGMTSRLRAAGRRCRARAFEDAPRLLERLAPFAEREDRESGGAERVDEADPGEREQHARREEDDGH